MRAALLAVLLLFCGAARSHAQTAGDNLRVYLVTFGPGEAVWEKFGHNAIWLHDETADYGVAYNWGMFSFDQPGFVPRLMKGRMLYWMAGYEINAMVNAYVQSNRSVWAQELNLTPVQRDSMRAFLDWNAREENKFYLYDYFRDNCSTRVRDAIDRATGGALQRALKPAVTDETYRTHTANLTYTDVPIYTGLMLAMGPRIDRKLTVWEEGFIPMELMESVRSVRVRGADGSDQPLVLSERTLFTSTEAPATTQDAPNRTVGYTIVGAILGGLLLLLGYYSRNKRGIALLLAIIIGVWCLAVGVFGTLIALLWAFTDHVVTYNNENLLQANPLSLVLMVFAPAAVMGKAWARRWAVWFGLFIAGISAVGLFVQIFPGLDQANGEVIGLMFPVHGAIAFMLWQRWHITHDVLARDAAPRSSS